MMNTVTASIDIDALQHNFTVVRRHAPHSKIIAVLKANAYGHGLLQVAHALAQADAYAVARVEEALVLRANAITKPILVLGGFFSAEALPLLAKHELQTTLHTWEQLALLEQASLPAPIKVWLKLDTGMNRLGLRTLELPAFIERLSHCRNVVQPFHLMTHFSQSDDLLFQFRRQPLCSSAGRAGHGQLRRHPRLAGIAQRLDPTRPHALRRLPVYRSACRRP